MISGINPLVLHLTNILIHIANVVLVYIILIHFGFKRKISMAASILFGIYPTVVPSVSWIPGRNDSLLCLFLLLSWFALIKFMENIQSGANFSISLGKAGISFLKNKQSFATVLVKSLILLLSLFFYGLALFTKETAIIYILFLGIYLILYSQKKSYIEIAAIFWGYISVFILYGFVYMQVMTAMRGANWATFVANFFDNLLYIIPIAGEVVIPYKLSFLKHLGDADFIRGMAVWVVMIIFFIKMGVRDKGLFILGFFMAIFSFLPVFLFLSQKTDNDVYFVANRYYIPFLGVIFMILSTKFWEGMNKRFMAIAVKVVIIIIAFISLTGSFVYKDPVSFWTNEAYASANSFRTNFEAGVMYYDAGRYEESLNYFKAAAAVSPNQMVLFHPIALSYLQNRDIHTAIKYFEQEILVSPPDSNLHFQIGLLYYKIHDFDRAKFHFQESLLINPLAKLSNYNLGVIALGEGKNEEARVYFTKELEVNQGYQSAMEALRKME